MGTRAAESGPCSLPVQQRAPNEWPHSLASVSSAVIQGNIRAAGMSRPGPGAAALSWSQGVISLRIFREPGQNGQAF